jgi:hypothetical protein
MPSTYEPIATTTLGSVSNTITFSGIPSTYTDLRIVLVGRTSVPQEGQTMFWYYNGSTAGNYSNVILSGNASSPYSANFTNASYFRCNGFNGTYPSVISMDIFSYAGSTNKTCLLQVSTEFYTFGQVQRIVGLWRQTSAITSVTVEYPEMQVGTMATIYGIKAA